MASTKLAITDTLPLPNSTVKIPRLGFGVYEPLGRDCVVAVLAALKAGYRHIDTAQDYGNEKEVGEAFRQSGLKRSEVFITTKIAYHKGSVEDTYQCVLDSARAIDGEDGLVDLFLVHTADIGLAGRREVWLALEKLLEAGRARSIGVSNDGIGHIEEIMRYAKIWPPMINQIEKNWTPLPKSVTPSRIVQNADVYGFELSEDDMKMLDDLDQGTSGSLLGLLVE